MTAPLESPATRRRTISAPTVMRLAAMGTVAAIAVGFTALAALPAARADEGSNHLPVAVADFYSTPFETLLTVATPGASVLANDSDEDGEPLLIDGVEPPAQGNLTLDNATGYFTYQPAAGFWGDVTFAYYLIDQYGASQPCTVTITVGPPANYPPVASDDFYTIGAGQTLIVAAPGFLSNDVDPEGATLVLDTAGPIGGSILGESNQMTAEGGFTYTPAPGFTGTRQYEYRASDGGSLSNWAVITFEVTAEPVEQLHPVGAADEYTTPYETTLNVAAPGLMVNDSDADSGFMMGGWTIPSHGDVTVFNAATGAFTYVPDAGWSGTDSFTYFLRDDNGNESDDITVTIHVEEDTTPQHTAPVAAPDTYSVVQGGSLTTTVGTGLLINDTDVDGDSLSVVSSTDPTQGQITSMANDGVFTYVAPSNFVGDVTFTYIVGDDYDQGNQATVTISVLAPGNHAPVAAPDSYSTFEGVALAVSPQDGVLANDADADADLPTVKTVSVPSSGTVTLDASGAFTYTPAAGFVGTATFDYQIWDGTLVSDPATVSIDVVDWVDGEEPGDGQDDPSGDPNPGSDLPTNADGDSSASTLASTGSSVSALAAFAALLLLAVGGVVMRHGRARSSAK